MRNTLLKLATICMFKECMHTQYVVHFYNGSVQWKGIAIMEDLQWEWECAIENMQWENAMESGKGNDVPMDLK